MMRLLSKLVLSYAAVATALTNVGFGGKRGSNKHFQDLDLRFMTPTLADGNATGAAKGPCSR